MLLDQFTSSSKFNLYLDLIAKDPKDGYHFLESIFVEIPWGDDFRITQSEQDSIIFNNNRENIEKENTVSKALRLFKEQFNIQDSFTIEIDKNVPMGAGLGGGSGDAGSLLKWLAHRYTINVQDCLEIAQKIGSDVPFFLYGGIALVTGKGEKITPLENKFKKGLSALIIYPNISISTKEAFQKIAPYVTSPKIHLNDADFLKKSLWDIDIVKKINYNIFNSKLEDISSELFYISQIFREKLLPDVMFMSGSGSSFILLYEKRVNLDKAHKLLGHVNPCSAYIPHF